MSSKETVAKVNTYFEGFISEIQEVRESVDKESEFTRGYLKCMSDVIEGSLNDDCSKVMSIIEKRMDMKYRAEVIDEILGGLTKLLSAYKVISDGSDPE